MVWMWLHSFGVRHSCYCLFVVDRYVCLQQAPVLNTSGSDDSAKIAALEVMFVSKCVSRRAAYDLFTLCEVY